MSGLVFALLLAIHGAPVTAALGPHAPESRRAEVSALVVKHALMVDIDPTLVAAIISIENPRLLPRARNKSNVGVMQVHTAWLRRKDWQTVCGTDLTDMDTNICFGVRVLTTHLIERRELASGLLAYNGCKSQHCRRYVTRVLARRDAALLAEAR